MTTKKPNRLTREILETADDQQRLGLMDDATHGKITLRNLGADILHERLKRLKERLR